MPTRFFISILAVLLLAACQDADNTTDHRGHQHPPLPIIGEVEVVDGDTLYHTVGDWAFYRQDSQLVREDMLRGVPYVADFFFTSCPTICPRVTRNMLRINERMADHPDFKLVSFTVDPKRDSVAHLRYYSENLGINDPDRWWFLTGDKFELYDIADDYFSVAVEDPSAPGGFNHSGRILFVDGDGHVRGFADGTDEEAVDKFMLQIEQYLQERERN